MSDFKVLTRRMLLKDMGKAGLALMVLGTACTSDDSGSSTAAADAATSTTGGPLTTTTSTTPATSTSGAPNEGFEWQQVDLGFVSAYVLYRSGEAIVIDTGVSGSADAIEAALGQVGLGWGDVGGMVVTHLHDDHQGSVRAVIEATSESLPWYAGAADLAAIRAPTEGTPVGDGDIVGAGLEIIETPGHTDGHIAVLDPLAGVLVAGDALTGTDGGVSGSNQRFTADVAAANASVSKLASFDYEVALFGHGDPLLSGASDAVAALASSLDG